MTDARRLIYDLRPPLLDDLGFIPAIQKYVERFAEETGISAKVDARDIQAVPEATEMALFRVIQEALTNVRRHSKATKANVVLDEDDRSLKLVVSDNGQGFCVEKLTSDGQPHFGLETMRERLLMCRGTFLIESRRGHGTMVRGEVPLPR